MKWQWLHINTTKSHESFRMELPGPWEPIDSWSVAGICAALGTQSGLLIKDKDKIKKNEESEGKN